MSQAKGYAAKQTKNHGVRLTRLGERIRAARHVNSLTMKSVAETLGLSVGRICQFETGATRIPEKHLWRFAELVGIPFAELSEGCEDYVQMAARMPTMTSVVPTRAANWLNRTNNRSVQVAMVRLIDALAVSSVAGKDRAGGEADVGADGDGDGGGAARRMSDVAPPPTEATEPAEHVTRRSESRALQNQLSAVRHAEAAARRAGHAEIDQRDEAKLAEELHAAMVRGDSSLGLVYHPMVRLSDGGMLGFRAELRWRSTDYGVVSPAYICRLAAAHGMAAELDYWIVQEALIDVGRPLSTCPRMALHIRGTGQFLSDPGACEAIAATVDDGPLKRSQLCFEVSASECLADAGLRDSLATLRGSGFTIAVDGVEMSRLADITQLDLAPSVVVMSGKLPERDAAGEHRLVQAIAACGQQGVTVISSDLVTVNDLAAAARLGFEAGQGFYFSPGLSANGVALVVLSRRPPWQA